MNKINLAVIFGGKSSEYEVSLASASCVLKHINKDKYNVIKIGITKDGKSYLYTGDDDKIPNGEWVNDKKNIKPATFSTNGFKGILVFNDDITTVEKINLDVAFPVLHGKNCEDGTYQGYLTICDIPYVGCDTLASAMCMDKEITHIVLEKYDVKMAKFRAILKNDYINEINKADFISDCENNLLYPMFVKPSNAGSSVGVSKAHNRNELLNAIDLAFVHDKKILVEEMLVGKEVECAVLGNNEPTASSVGDIEAANEWYDYNAKYQNENSVTNIPAKINEVSYQKARDIAVFSYKTLGCMGLSRVDFFVNGDEVILNEINTIPGFTNISMYPKLWEHSGVKYDLLIDELINLAFTKE